MLAVEKTDAEGLVHFAPGLSRGAGGLAPGLLVASDGKADYNFLDLQQTAFDLTDRGVKGRDAGQGARRLRLCRARRLSFRRDRASRRLAARQRGNRRQRAADPGDQAPRRRRVQARFALPDKGLGGRDLDVALPARRRLRRLDCAGLCRSEKPGALARPLSWSRITSPSAWTWFSRPKPPPRGQGNRAGRGERPLPLWRAGRQPDRRRRRRNRRPRPITACPR